MRRITRLLIGGVAVSAMVAALSACAPAAEPEENDPSEAAPTATGEVVVSTSGGDYLSFQQQFVLPEVPAGVEIVYDSGDQTARETKIRTQAGDDVGTFDVHLGADSDLQKMVDAGFMQELDLSKIPNYEYVPEHLRNPYWIPHIQSPLVIIYNKEQVKPAPTSYEDLWDPKYEGRIGIMDSQWVGSWFAAAAVEQGGFPEGDWGEDALDGLKALKPSTQVFAGHAPLGDALMSGQVWMALNWNARAYQWADQGEPLGAVVAEEGTFATVFGAGIPKNAPNPDAAYAYLNAMLAPAAQGQFAAAMGYTPTVTNPDLTDEELAALSVPEEDQDRVASLDIEYVAKHTNDWAEIWQREIVQR